jgi:hypothetical protein
MQSQETATHQPIRTPATASSPLYFLGLDLGQARDFTALAVLERNGSGREAEFHARHLQRWPLGTSYPQIVRDLSALLGHQAFASTFPTLAVDQTGVGAAVVDILRQAGPRARLVPVHITGGDQVTQEGGVTRVPKRDLVSVTQTALQTGRLKVAAALPEAETLQRELQNFQVKVTLAANDTYGAWREGTHDDLVLAVALGLWAGGDERAHPLLGYLYAEGVKGWGY